MDTRTIKIKRRRKSEKFVYTELSHNTGDLALCWRHCALQWWIGLSRFSPEKKFRAPLHVQIPHLSSPILAQQRGPAVARHTHLP